MMAKPKIWKKTRDDDGETEGNGETEDDGETEDGGETDVSDCEEEGSNSGHSNESMGTQVSKLSHLH